MLGNPSNGFRQKKKNKSCKNLLLWYPELTSDLTAVVLVSRLFFVCAESHGLSGRFPNAFDSHCLPSALVHQEVLCEIQISETSPSALCLYLCA